MGAREELLAIPDAAMRKGNITESVLVEMEFSTGARRWWAGWGALEAYGHTWDGTGDVISVSSVSAGYDASAAGLQFGLAGTPEMLAILRGSDTVFKGRRVAVWGQLFLVSEGEDLPDSGGVVPMQPIGPRFAQYVGTMERMRLAIDGLQGSQITLDCESVFTKRNAPPRGLLTDADQRARHSGDRGCERVATYENYNVKWF